MQVVKVKSVKDKVRKVRSLITLAGNQIGSVHFIKRSDGTKRKMSYRLHVQKPTYASSPTGKRFKQKKAKDSDNNLITVFDTNAVRYNNKSRMCGRGEYKSIPLDGVTRIKVGGEIYKIIS